MFLTPTSPYEQLTTLREPRRPHCAILDYLVCVSYGLANLRAEGALSGPVSSALSGPVSKREGERRGGNDEKRGLRTFPFCAPCEAGARKVFDPSAKEKRREENGE